MYIIITIIVLLIVYYVSMKICKELLYSMFESQCKRMKYLYKSDEDVNRACQKYIQDENIYYVPIVNTIAIPVVLILMLFDDIISWVIKIIILIY